MKLLNYGMGSLIIIFCSFRNLNKNAAPATHEKWVILNVGKLDVSGSTNINDFLCRIQGNKNQDTLVISCNRNPGGTFEVNGKIRYNVDEFKCTNPLMTRELKKTLESDKFPQMTVRAVSFDSVPDFDKGDQMVKATINICLHGSNRLYVIDCHLHKEANDVVSIDCSRMVSFSDFGITSPNRLGGLIKVRNQLYVHIYLAIRAV